MPYPFIVCLSADLPISPSISWQLSIEESPLGQSCVLSDVYTAEVCLVLESAPISADKNCYISAHIQCVSTETIWAAPGLPSPNISNPAIQAPPVEIVERPIDVAKPPPGKLSFG